MADFRRFASRLLENEGGYVHHPEDKGGPTNMGITLKTFQSFMGKDKNAADLKQMSMNTWNRIIKEGYWDRCKADDINSQSVAEIFADWLVNSGGVAIRKVQDIVGVNVDGIVGSITIAAVNAMNATDLFGLIKQARVKYYDDIAENDPTQKIFLKGWKNRIDSFTFED